MERNDELDVSKIVQLFSEKVPPASLSVAASAVPPKPKAPEPEASEPELSEPEDKKHKVKLFGKGHKSKKAAATAVEGDTIRLDEIQKAVKAAQEEMQQEKVDLDQTIAFAPLQPGVFGEQEVEPFSRDWGPVYEEVEQLEEFQIPEPVIHRPKSRLSELREKLVEGPEKRYYALSEQGVKKTLVSLILNGLILLFCAVMTGLFALGIISPDRLRLMVFAQFLAMMLSALLGCYQMIEGVTDLLHRRFTPNTLLCLTFLACCVDSVLCLNRLRISVCAVFCLQTTMALWAAHDRRNTEMGQMDTLRRATNLNGLAYVEDDYNGMMGFRICRGEVEHFMDHYDKLSGPDRLLNWYCLAVTAVSLAVAVLGGVLHGFDVAVQLFAASLMVGMPATAFLSTVRPLEVLEKRLHKLGTVICGWQAVENVRRRIVVPLNDKDLFPDGAVKLNGVKFYGDCDPNLTVAYTTALIKENGGALVSLFEQLRDSRGGEVFQVENLHPYNDGIGGEFGDVAVLVGTLQFMQDMGIDMGKGIRVSQAVYAAVDGELSGVFAVTYNKSKSSAAGIRTLCGCRSITAVMTTKDFMLTESFIRSKFTVSTRRIAFPDRATRHEICGRPAPEGAPVIALTTKEGLAPMAYAITGARTLGSAMKMGVVIHMIGGILGLIIMAALAYIGAVELLSPLNILLYQLIWMIPGFLVTEWTRTL